MQTRVTTTAPESVACDVLALPVYQDGKTLPPSTLAVDKALGGWVREVIADGEITGKLGQWSLLHARGTIPAKCVLVVGLGKADHFHRAKVDRVAAVVARVATARKLTRLAIPLVGIDRPDLSAEAVAASLVQGVTVGCHRSVVYKSDAPDRKPPRSLHVLVDTPARQRRARAGIQVGRAVAEAINFARDLVNEPAGTLTPIRFAQLTRGMARRMGLKCTVMDEKRMRAERMTAILAVSQGSKQPPRVMVLEYRGAAKGSPPKTLGLVGKGITFDSGGLSLKTTMLNMKADMAGAAAVVGTMQAAAALKLPVNLIGIVAGTENLPGGNAYKPGDVVTARNGKSFEIISTDAEGRVQLSDLLCYAVDRKVDHLVDVATLTGACSIALGNGCIAAMTNNDPWCRQVIGAAATAGERMWQLPMWPEYRDLIDSHIAEFKNAGPREAGTIVGGKFLEEFVSDVPWVHLDIAGSAYRPEGSDHLDPGATGAAVRTLVELAASYR